MCYHNISLNMQEEDEEDESDALVNQVLDEIGIEMNAVRQFSTDCERHVHKNKCSFFSHRLALQHRGTRWEHSRSRRRRPSRLRPWGLAEAEAEGGAGAGEAASTMTCRPAWTTSARPSQCPHSSYFLDSTKTL